MKRILWILLILPFSLQAQGNAQSGAEKSGLCAVCHGVEGISENPLYPNLAGQHQSYLIKQLHDFKKGKTRYAPTMSPLTQTLSEQDIEDLAAYYAQFKIAQGKTPKQYLKRGELLYRGGDRDKKITACIACHGPQGTGNAQAKFPVLSGQVAEYLVQQLKAFRDKKRHNDLNAIMRDISSHLDEEDMTALAYYCRGLH